MKTFGLFIVILIFGLISPRGAHADKSYEAEVPDTLDLAERGTLALNAMTSCVDPNDYYNHYFLTRLTAEPAYMIHMDIGDFLCCNPKWLEAIPLLRAMSGSRQNLDIDNKMMGATVDLIDPQDGLFYLPPADMKEKPWYKRGNYAVINEPITSPFGNSRLMLAMMACYGRDHDPVWRERLQKAAGGLAKTAMFKDDYAYYPEGKVGMEFAYLKHSGYNYKDEAEGEHEGAEGSVITYHGAPIRALARWHEMSGDKEALELAGKLSRFVMKPKMWGAQAGSKYTNGQEHAHFDGHHHGTCIALRGLLEYANVANDEHAKQFARDGFEFMRGKGIGRIGNFGDFVWKAQTEGCTIADMVALAIRLSDYGVGDYWDDADQVIRNHLVESQFVDKKLMEKVAHAAVKYPNAWKEYKLPEASGLGRGADQWDRWDKNIGQKPETRDVLERNVGNFAAFLLPTTIPYPGTSGCCAGNLGPALYYAWEAIVRCKDGNAQVNLLLNRASPWLDVLSWLPYEGKVELKNKSAKRIAVRIPRWVERAAVQCAIDGAKTPTSFVGNFLTLDNVEGKKEIEITFPMITQTVRLTMPFDKAYTMTFKGHTLIDIEPRETNPTGYPIYQREHYKQSKAPMIKKTQFVADALPGW